MIEAYRTGTKSYSHCSKLSDNQTGIYFEVDMEPDDIKAFAELLHVKEDAAKFYACLVIIGTSSPKTFVAYKNNNGFMVNLTMVSTGIQPIELLEAGMIGGLSK